MNDQVLSIQSATFDIGNLYETFTANLLIRDVTIIFQPIDNNPGRTGRLPREVAPGSIETEMVMSIPDKAQTRLLNQIPLKRFGKA